MPDLIIETKDLVKKFYAGKPNEIVAVNQINLQIKDNSCTVLQGASGSGKTTLLTVLSGLAKPTSGEYICLGEKISRWSEKFLTQFRQKHIGIIFQQFQLIKGFTAYTNLAIPLYPLRYNLRQIDQLIQQVAEQVNIRHRLDYQVDTLSGGEMQRVAIARALINQPQIIFADEPTSHLDSQASENIMQIFADLKAQGKTLFITTHDPRVQNSALIDYKIEMKDGKIENTSNF
ncbi:MAG: ABC transporter ATP-binding protein [Microscillaceae bacterium]|jgi:putative ABC transport system ATP-binding protein|nr:ABC transporter ATP-binding protein [Microscillaceae bacterium]